MHYISRHAITKYTGKSDIDVVCKKFEDLCCMVA